MLLIALFAALFAGFRTLGLLGIAPAVVLGLGATVLLTTRITFRVAFTVAVAAWTAIAVGAAFADRSWGALAIAMVIGPSVNGVAALLGVVYIVVQRVRDVSFRWVGALVTVIASTLISTAVIYWSLLLIDLHGG